MKRNTTCLVSADSPGRPESPRGRTPKSRLWLWFVAAFVAQGAAWTAWFTIAAKHPVESVPLATADASRP